MRGSSKLSLCQRTHRIYFSKEHQGCFKAKKKIMNELGSFKKDILANQYRERPNVYFNKIVRKAQALSDLEIAILLDDAEDGGMLTESEANYIRRSDAIVTGRSKLTGEMLYLTIEASVVLDGHDAQRAAQRAKLLSKIPNVNAVGVIAGDKIDPRSRVAIKQAKVWCVTNGTVIEIIDPSGEEQIVS